jgi:beta-glucosidase
MTQTNHAVPWGFGKLVTYLHKRYKVPIIITEFGFAVKGEANLPVEEAIKDTARVNYYKGAIASTIEATKTDGVVIRGIYPWCKLSQQGAVPF